jgi:hypothetical protein
MAELDDTDESKRRKLSKKCRLPRPHGSLIDETKVNKGKSKTKFGKLFYVVWITFYDLV